MKKEQKRNIYRVYIVKVFSLYRNFWQRICFCFWPWWNEEPVNGPTLHNSSLDKERTGVTHINSFFLTRRLQRRVLLHVRTLADEGSVLQSKPQFGAFKRILCHKLPFLMIFGNCLLTAFSMLGTFIMIRFTIPNEFPSKKFYIYFKEFFFFFLS